MVAISLITLDLDDTLWPCAPVISAAEAALYAWLGAVAERVAASHDAESLRQHRRELMRACPEIAHDLTEVRRRSLVGLLAAFDYDPALADEGVAVFLEHRNRVAPYGDVLPNLLALRERYCLVSVTNGNADVAETPLRGVFHRSLTATGVGAARPDPRLLLAALDQTNTEPAAALHVGDDPYLDVEVARGVGMAAAWVNRRDLPWPAELPAPAVEVRDLSQLLGWLGWQDP